MTPTNEANFPIKSHLYIYIRPGQTNPIYGRFLECCWFLTLSSRESEYVLDSLLLKLRMVGPKVPSRGKKKKKVNIGSAAFLLFVRTIYLAFFFFFLVSYVLLMKGFFCSALGETRSGVIIRGRKE